MSNATRLLSEIAALQEAGATVTLVTANPDPQDKPPGITYHVAPLTEPRVFPGAGIPASHVSWRPYRIVQNMIRNAWRGLARRLSWKSTRTRRSLLTRLAARTDIFWVVDFPALASTLSVARRTRTKVIYNTVDLVPEYSFYGEHVRRRRLAEERRLIPQIDSFVTACDSYADYYQERYGQLTGFRRPVVHGNAPHEIASGIRPTGERLRFLFFGSLTFNRPIAELLEAVSLTRSDIALTFMGENLIGQEPHETIERLGLADRVVIEGPCSLEDAVRVVGGYDVGIAALRGADENERRAETSKVHAYMAAGIAILGSDLPGIARVIRAHRNGWLVGGMSPEAWAEAFDMLASLPRADVDAAKQASLEAAPLYRADAQLAAFVAEFVRVAARM